MGGRYPSIEEVREVYDALRELGSEGPAPLARLREAARGVGRDKVRVVLSLMKEFGVVRELRGARFSLRREALGAEDLARMAREWKERADADRERLEKMEAYARSARCRWRVLHHYFGAEMPEKWCDGCDNCLKGLAREADRPQ